MPKSKAGGDNSRLRVQREQKRRPRPKKTIEPGLHAGQEDKSHVSKTPLGTDSSQDTFERHVALLGDSRLSLPMYASQRATIARQLQRDYGNRYVQRLVDHISRMRSEAVQTTLTVGPAGDKYELEADRVAEQVMESVSSPGPEAAQRQAPEEEEIEMKGIQRQALGEEEEEVPIKRIQRQGLGEEEEEVQIKAAQPQIGLQGGDVEPGVEQSIQKARGQGQHLPEGVRAPMEDAFGADFSGVSVHTDAESDALNDSMSARAFTTGQDIFFRQGEYKPGSSADQEVLAHELTHVVQQNPEAIQRNGGGVKGLASKFEQAAVSAKFEPATLNDPTEMASIAKKIKIKQFLEVLKSSSISFKRSITAIVKYFSPVKLNDLKPLVQSANAKDRKAVWSDSSLMTQAEAKLGTDTYLTFVTQLGMHQAPTTDELEEGGKEHTPAPKADELIRNKLDALVANAAAAGRKIVGKVAVVAGADWDRAGIAHYGETTWKTGPPPKTPKKDAINGFVDSKGRVWIERNSGNAGTLIHEGIHKYSDGAILSNLGFQVNEGMTEYFTRTVCKDMSVNRGNYENNYKVVDILVKNVASKEILAKAYFEGDIAELKKAFVKYRKDTKHDDASNASLRWDVFVSFFRSGDYANARWYIS